MVVSPGVRRDLTKKEIENMLYGVYSEQQKQFTGELEYTTPDGGTVIVTEVGSRGCPHSLWPDKVDKGQVEHCVRVITRPAFNGKEVYD